VKLKLAIGTEASSIASQGRESLMNINKRWRLTGVVLAGLAVMTGAFAGTAHASTTMIPVPGGSGGTGVQPEIVRTVVVGGMPGWQIALIAVVAARVAAVAAVLADRSRAARRRLSATHA
jgi:hypothetical protein